MVNKVRLKLALIVSLITMLALSLVFWQGHKYYDGFQIIGFSNHMESSELSYSTAYGFNPVQKYQLDAQNKLISFQNNVDYKTSITKRNESIDIWYSYIQESGILIGTSLDKQNFSNIHNGVIQINNCDNLVSIQIGVTSILKFGNDGVCYFYIDRVGNVANVGFQSFSKNFSNWELAPSLIKLIKLTHYQNTIAYLVSPNQITNLDFDESGIVNNLHLYQGIQPFTFMLGKSIAVFLVGVFIFVFMIKYGSIKYYIKNISSLSSIFIALYFCIFLGALFPGILMWDAMSPIVTSSAQSFYLWYGLGIDLIYMVFINVFGNHGVAVFQWFLLFVLIISIDKYAKENNVSLWLRFVLFLIMSISCLGYMSMYLYRDVIGATFTCISLFCLYSVIRKYKLDKRLSVSLCALVMVSSYIAYLIRSDNLIIMSCAWLYVGIIIFKAGLKKYTTIMFVIFLALLKLTDFICVKVDPGYEDNKPVYLSASLINPIAGVMLSPSYLKESGDYSSLNLMLNHPESINQEWSASHVIYWHQDHKYINKDDIRVVEKTFISLMLRYPIEFLKVRFTTFLLTLNAQPLSTTDFSIDQHNQGKLKLAMDYDMYRNYTGRFYQLVNSYNDALINFAIIHLYRPDSDNIGQDRLSFIQVIPFFMYILAFISLLICAASILWLPLTGITSTILLLRAIAVFILAPASVFTYYLDVYIWLFVGPILFYIEFMDRKQKNG